MEQHKSNLLPLRSALRAEVPLADEKFRLLVEAVADYAIFWLDSDGFIRSWNAGAQRFKGYTREEAIGKHFSIFYTPEDVNRKHPEEELAIARKDGRFEEEGWRVKKDGSVFWANVVITRVTDESGKVVGFAKVTRDITERKFAEEQLRVTEERYRMLVSAVKDYAIFMLDPQGNVVTWNEGAQALKGYLPSEIIGQHFSKFYPEEDIRASKPGWELEEATMTGRLEDEGWRIRKNGTRFWANVVITAVRNSKGKLMGFSKVTRDMTDRRRLEDKLRRANEELDERVKMRTTQLEQAIRARDEFMGIISHELRTPVVCLKLQTELALRHLHNHQNELFLDHASKFMTSVDHQLDNLESLISDILDTTRISMDQLRLDKALLNLSEIAQEVIDQFRDQMNANACKLNVDLASNVKIVGDRRRLEQVFSNLLMNAAKFGKGKPIRVSLRAENGFAVFKVEDQGVGIAAEDLEQIFKKFGRAKSAKEFSGMGVGLFISHEIVKKHLGSISVESALSKGSSFSVKLSLA